MENLIGQMVHVCVSKGGKTATKLLKVCKVKARSVLFIEVDKEIVSTHSVKLIEKILHLWG